MPKQAKVLPHYCTCDLKSHLLRAHESTLQLCTVPFIQFGLAVHVELNLVYKGDRLLRSK